MEKRRRLSPAEQERVVQRQRHKCACGCGETLKARQIQFDHRLALQFGGTNDLENFDALITKHHRQKSNDENTARAKCDRIRLKHERKWGTAEERALSKRLERTRQIEN